MEDGENGEGGGSQRRIGIGTVSMEGKSQSRFEEGKGGWE